MQDFTIDFETYCDSECSITKLGALEYVRHPKFKVHGAAIKFDDSESIWATHDELVEVLNPYSWENLRVISHNANFDLLVLHEIYGIHPGRRVDTLGLCRALLPRGLDFDLDSICRMLGISDGKRGAGKALADVKGVEDPTPEQMKALGFYACGDADDCYGLYKALWPHLPEAERRFMDLCLRFSTQGIFENHPDALQALRDARQEVLEDRRTKLEKISYTPAQLRSRDQFAQILRDHGVEPPTKISPATNEPTYAFSKQDPDFMELCADPRVGDIVAARLAVSSNNAITRIDRIERILQSGVQTLPVQLNYNGAHTGRLSGGAKINAQNLNARGVGSGVRRGLRVRDEYVVLVLDEKAIELRLNMWFSKQEDVLEAIRQGGDVYVDEAMVQFGKDREDVTKPERFYGKVIRLGCMTGDTPVLTPAGWQRLDSIPTTVPVWDGIEWVSHDGPIYQGVQDTICLGSLRITPDHKVLCGTTWHPAADLAQNPNTLRFALATASEALSSAVSNWENVAVYAGSSFSATAEAGNNAHTPTTCVKAKPSPAISALRRNETDPQRNTGATPTLSQTKNTEPDCLTAYPRRSLVATIQMTRAITATADAVSTFIQLGAKTKKTVENFWRTSSHWMAGMIPSWNWIALTATGGTNRGTSDSVLDTKTSETNAGSKTCNNASSNSRRKLPVFDLLNAGPRKRFTILTDNGPLIVHNCQYGMGAPKFRIYVATGPMGMEPKYLTLDEAYGTINTYRFNHQHVVATWDWLTNVAIPAMHSKDIEIERGPVLFRHEECVLPNGLAMSYPNLQPTENGWVFGFNQLSNLWGGTTLENICQALAGVLIKEQMNEIDDELDGDTFTRLYQGPQFNKNLIDADIRDRLRNKAAVIHQVHDEILIACRASDVDFITGTATRIMTRSPRWAPDLPLEVEGGHAQEYSK